MTLSEFYRNLFQEEVRKGMLVTGRVDRIEEHGVYIDLDLIEAEGYCPVRELSSRRVTTPKDIVHRNQQVIGKIYKVKRGGQVLSVSLKRVTDKEEKQKREEWGRLKQTFSIFQTLDDKLDLSMEKIIEILGRPLLKYFRTVYEGLKEIVIEGKDLLEELEKVPNEYMEEIYSVLKSSIKVSKRRLKKEIVLKTLTPNGIERIKGALEKAREVDSENIEITYLSAPNYKVEVEGYRWKDASKLFNKFKEKLEEAIKEFPSEWKTTLKVKEKGKRG